MGCQRVGWSACERQVPCRPWGWRGPVSQSVDAGVANVTWPPGTVAAAGKREGGRACPSSSVLLAAPYAPYTVELLPPISMGWDGIPWEISPLHRAPMHFRIPISRVDGDEMDGGSHTHMGWDRAPPWRLPSKTGFVTSAQAMPSLCITTYLREVTRRRGRQDCRSDRVSTPAHPTASRHRELSDESVLGMGGPPAVDVCPSCTVPIPSP